MSPRRPAPVRPGNRSGQSRAPRVKETGKNKSQSSAQKSGKAAPQKVHDVAPESRTVLRLGGPDSMPIFMRAIVLVIAIIFSFGVTFRPIRQYLYQRSQYEQISQQVADSRATNTALEEELAKWNDDTYVETQARERLSYVMPGETTYLVVDADTVEAESTGTETDKTTSAVNTPWYITLKDSAYVAGEVDNNTSNPAQQGWSTPTPSATASASASPTTPSEKATP